MPSILQKKMSKQSTLVGFGFVKNISNIAHESQKEKTMLIIKQKHAEEEERQKQVKVENRRKRKRNIARLKVEENHKRQQLRNENERGSVLVFDVDGKHHMDASCGVEIDFEILDDYAIEEKMKAERYKKQKTHTQRPELWQVRSHNNMALKFTYH